jgi:hypothetical protein
LPLDPRGYCVVCIGCGGYLSEFKVAAHFSGSS